MDPSTPKDRIRYAPSFTLRDVPEPAQERPYTAQSIGEFLGWLEPSGAPKTKIRYILFALQFIEEGILSEKDFDGLTTEQDRSVVVEARIEDNARWESCLVRP